MIIPLVFGIWKTIKEFEQLIGLDKLKLMHLNDSKGDLGSGIDRHEHIGLGKIGDEGFIYILRSELGKVPVILETPVDSHRSDIDNLKKVKELWKIAQNNSSF